MKPRTLPVLASRTAADVPSAPLRAVLELDIFRRAQAHVVCGEDHLDRQVRWVHAAEISDIARFLSGGELLLTAGTSLGTTRGAQESYVASLAQAGVAGLAVETAGRVLETLPPAVIEAADRHGLVLIELRHEIPFVEASAQVSHLLGDAAVREAQRTVTTVRELTSRLAAGAGHVELVRTLAKSLERGVALESADHDLQASYGGSGPDEQMLQDWAGHARSLDEHRDTDGDPLTCLRRPVLVQGMTWGYLHVAWDGAASQTDKVIVESGASAIAISLLNERVTDARGRHQQAILINRLEGGDIDGPAFIERALRLGKDLRGSALVSIALGMHGEGPADLERAVTKELRAAAVSAVTADVGDAVMAVVAVGSLRSADVLTQVLASDDRSVGISRLVQPVDLRVSLQQARAALMARRPVQRFEDLGLLKLLVPLCDGPELAAFVEDELGALIAYDNEHDAELLRTLTAFLRADGNKTTAARDLFVQRRTLYYRLDRIRRVLGLDPEDVDVRIRLQVAVQAAALLRDNRAITRRAP